MELGTSSDRMRGHAAMLTFSALIAGSFSFGSTIANDIDPVALTVARFILASMVLGALAALGPGLKAAHFRAPWRHGILGALFAVYFVLMFEGLKTATPVSTAAVFTLTPILAAAFGWLLLRQITTPRMVAALCLGGVGALWVIFRADLGALLSLDIGRGEAIFLVGVTAHALYTPLVPKLNRGEPALVFTLGMTMSAVVILLLYGGGKVVATDWAALPMRVWLVLVYLVIFTGTITFVLLQYAAMRLPAAKVMAYGYLVPSWVICWEVALGRGLPSPMVLIGVGLTLVALALLLKHEA